MRFTRSLVRRLGYTHLHPPQVGRLLMSTATPKSGTGFRGWYKRQSRIGRISFILTAAIAAMLLLGRAAHTLELLFIGPIILCALVLSPLAIILLYRWVTRRLLWKVRNRLIVTYALMSVAPVVLCLTLFGIAAYIFGGQFATTSAITLLDQASAQVRDETASLALLTAARSTHSAEQAAEPDSSMPLWIASVNSAGTLQPLLNPLSANKGGDSGDPFLGESVPSWLHSGFHGIVGYQGKLYLCAYEELPQAGHTLAVLGTRPLDKEMLRTTAQNLGRVLLLPGIMGRNNSKFSVEEDDNKSDSGDGHVNVVVLAPSKLKRKLEKEAQAAAKKGDAVEKFDGIDGGVLPPRAHLIDPPVVFSAPLNVTSWRTGDPIRSALAVFSRPSVLYTRLFATTNGLGTVIRIILVSIAILFGLLELFALLMAFGLSRTITRSVADLYQGTKEIDRGNLTHRVRVARHDQLGTLATSFNSMAASIDDLLKQQREKDRMLNELAIAQEVQINLYPRSPVSFAQLELHGVCLPARAVSGDYFDFIFGQGNGGQGNGGQNNGGRGSGLYLAFGDISGKGISAALLMASLHSAVRAFSLNTEDGAAAPPPSPALLLEMLNRHLFRSTAPEKYATLFLAYYDVASRRLTYSNGGHLPPLVISTDGSVQSLDCGGPVVGLLNGLEYEEATIELKPGDLMMAFTDGLTEPENETGEFGEQRLLEYVRVNRQEPLPELVAGALKTVQRWVGNQEQPDDMTLLLVRQI
jgi:sigma-B regulation protein RsbU (phosphoserine phosphatase)